MIDTTSPTGSLHVWFRRVYAPRVLRGRDPHTLELYEITLRHWTRHLGRAPAFADLIDDAVGEFLSARAQEVARATANKDHANITALWRYANRLRLVDTWPTLPKLTAPQRVPQAWTTGEMGRLFAEAARAPGMIGRVPTGDWWRALLLTVWDTGERIGAVWQVTWDDVDLAGGWVRVPAETRKGRRTDRLYRLSADALPALIAVRAKRRWRRGSTPEARIAVRESGDGRRVIEWSSTPQPPDRQSGTYGAKKPWFSGILCGFQFFSISLLHRPMQYV